MPVASDEQPNAFRGLEAEVPQVLESYWGSGTPVEAGVNNEPSSAAQVDKYRLAITRPEEGNLELVRSRWLTEVFQNER